MMTDERKQKLDDLGFVWKVRERADWNDRYEQLLEYKKENGNCVVPQVRSWVDDELLFGWNCILCSFFCLQQYLELLMFMYRISFVNQNHSFDSSVLSLYFPKSFSITPKTVP